MADKKCSPVFYPPQRRCPEYGRRAKTRTHTVKISSGLRIAGSGHCIAGGFSIGHDFRCR
jgi:hypothetical protein